MYITDHLKLFLKHQMNSDGDTSPVAKVKLLSLSNSNEIYAACVVNVNVHLNQNESAKR